MKLAICNQNLAVHHPVCLADNAEAELHQGRIKHQPVRKRLKHTQMWAVIPWEIIKESTKGKAARPGC